MDANKLISVLFKMKDKRAELQREFDTADGEIAAKQEKVEAALLAVLKEQGLDNISVNTPEHKFTVSRTVKSRVWPADWDAFRMFEQENPEFDFRERRVHQKNFHEFMAANPEADPPVNIDSKYVISTRRTKQ